MNQRITIGVLLIAAIAHEASAQNRTYRRRGVILGGLAGAALGVAIGDKGNNETTGALIGAAAGAIAGGAIGNQKDQRIEQEMLYRSGYYGGNAPGLTPPPQAYRSSEPVIPSPRSLPRGYLSRGVRHQAAVPAYNQPYIYPQGRSYLAPERSITGVDEPHQPRQVVLEPQSIVGPVTMDDLLSMTRSGASQPLILRQIEIRGAARQLKVSDVIALHTAGVAQEVIEAMQIKASQQLRDNGSGNPTGKPPARSPSVETVLPPPANPPGR